MDYIQPDTCTDAEFRKMWAEFEWENKIAVTTNIGEVGAYLDHILESTNMKCLTPKQVSCDSHVIVSNHSREYYYMDVTVLVCVCV